MTSQLESLKAELAEAQQTAELAKLKAELAEAKRMIRESNAAAATARKQTAAMGLKPIQLEQLRPALTAHNGPLKNTREVSSAELSSFSRPWRRLLAMMRAPKHSMARLTAEGLLRQLDVWYEDIGPKRVWFNGAAALAEWDKMASKPSQAANQAKQPSSQAAHLESGTTTSTGAKVW